MQNKLSVLQLQIEEQLRQNEKILDELKKLKDEAGKLAILRFILI